MKIKTIEIGHTGRFVGDNLSHEIDKRVIFDNELDHHVHEGVYHATRDAWISPERLTEILSGHFESGIVTACGSGEFHHFTYGICADVDVEFDYYHLDNHEDRDNVWGYELDCGNFVPVLEQLPQVKKVIWNESDITDRNLYLSIDLDILSEDVFTTKYDCGDWNVEQLLNRVEQLNKDNNIIGTDIHGYYTGDLIVYNEVIDILK